MASGSLILISAPVLLGAVVIGGLMGLTVASLGVVVSLRSPTVRQAEQTLGGVIVGLVAPFLLLQQLPAAWKAFLVAPEHVALMGYMIVGVLVALALGLTALAAHSFRRAQLTQV